jgi:PTS system ascorbate-specific IIA component
MSAGIVIVTHGNTGATLLEVAEFILGESLAEIGFVPFHQSGDQLTTIAEVRAAMARADTGDGVLVLTDLIGASPSNSVADALEAHSGVMVTGLNLAMLMSVWNYRGKPLGLLARKAVESGRRGVKIFQE